MKTTAVKKYETFVIKTDPRNISKLGQELDFKINVLQEIGWNIDRIDTITDYYAIDPSTKENVPTPYYIVVAWKNS